MNQPLASSVGNAVEVAECMEALTGRADGPPVDLTVDLCATLLVTCGAAADEAAARTTLRDALASGAAAERFGRMVAALGGSSDFVERWRDRLPQAPVIVDVPAGTSGHVSAIDGRALGMPSSAWRRAPEGNGDPVDPAVGLTRIARLGTRVAEGDPLFRLHAATTPRPAPPARRPRLHRDRRRAVEPRSLIHERVG
jgi:thymidine phosphorylase